MKLQQLRYIWEVNRHDLNISATALSLYTSQPGISKQIRLLEEELGVEIFTRNGKHLSKVTSVGKDILKIAGEILNKVDGIKGLSQDYKSPTEGRLSMATTHTQARYTLPSVIKEFVPHYPKVSLSVIQGTTKENLEGTVNGDFNFVIITEDFEISKALVVMPCFNYSSAVVVLKDHPLAKLAEVCLADIAAYPLVTHVFGHGFNTLGSTTLGQAFNREDLEPKIALLAGNADVIKSYVRADLGVGVLADLAYDPIEDSDLVVIKVPALDESYLCSIGIRKGSYIPGYMHEFIEGFSPHLTRDVVTEVMSLTSPAAQKKYFKDIEIPDYKFNHRTNVIME
ncbi:MAG: LysR family transcriptional regulator [Porticoccaceae bacterium]|nr:LysR family transcriptional regulator [Porticoccaceae bacterium]